MVSKKPMEKSSNQKSTQMWESSAISDENLQRLDRLANLGMLSAEIAHEVRNALVPIKTFVELMVLKSDDEELAAAVERELKRIDSIICQMLSFAAQKPTAFKPVNVHDVLEVSLRLLHHQINAKMISVTRDFKARPETIHGDESQLQQVVMNLLLNALEAMGINGTLTISTEAAKNEQGSPMLKLSIRDTGMGITRENLERIFEPFFTTKKRGTGLGLAISQRIVQEHAGKIEAQSEANKGSTFEILLPISE
jgi:signal transduction histidine kinase